MKMWNHNSVRALDKDKKIKFIFSKNQCSWIEETSAHLLIHWLTILVKDRQQPVNPGCQGWWMAGQNPTMPWSNTILEKCLPGPSLINNKYSNSKLQKVDITKGFGFSYHWLKSRALESNYWQSYASAPEAIWIFCACMCKSHLNITHIDKVY